MIRTASLAAAGGTIPRCFGFRLKPRPVSGAAVTSPPYPLRIRDQSTHQNEFLVYDSSWNERQAPAVADQVLPPLGPFLVDPNGELPGWAWDVTWADEAGERVTPQERCPSAPGVVLYDSGLVAAGAALDSGILCLGSWFGQVGLYVFNADAAARQVNLFSYLDDGTTQIGQTTLGNAAGSSWTSGSCGFGASTTNAPICSAAGLPPRGAFRVPAAGASNCRIVIVGR
jgi:hypothetical protein